MKKRSQKAWVSRREKRRSVRLRSTMIWIVNHYDDHGQESRPSDRVILYSRERAAGLRAGRGSRMFAPYAVMRYARGVRL